MTFFSICSVYAALRYVYWVLEDQQDWAILSRMHSGVPRDAFSPVETTESDSKARKHLLIDDAVEAATAAQSNCSR